jgi:hypothetical protein
MVALSEPSSRHSYCGAGWIRLPRTFTSWSFFFALKLTKPFYQPFELPWRNVVNGATQQAKGRLVGLPMKPTHWICHENPPRSGE